MQISERRSFRCFLIVSLLILLTACSASEYKTSAERATAKFRSQYNEAQYQNIYSEADEEFRRLNSEQDITAFLAALHRKLGRVTGFEQSGFRVNVQMGIGTFVILQYDTQFDLGKASEQFTWRISGESAALVRYDVNSTDLLMR